MRLFEISDEQNARVNTWLLEIVYPAVIEDQRKVPAYCANDFAKSCWEMGFPYEGAIGGGVTYSFTPTSLGTVTKVTSWGHELDLTEYGDW